MKVLGLIVIVALAAGLIFALLNQGVVMESREVRLPGGRFIVAPVGSVLVAAAGVLLLMLFAAWIQDELHRRALGRALSRLAQREHEIAGMKSRAYDDVSEKLDALREELARRLPSPDEHAVETPEAVGPLAGR